MNISYISEFSYRIDHTVWSSVTDECFRIYMKGEAGRLILYSQEQRKLEITIEYYYVKCRLTFELLS